MIDYAQFREIAVAFLVVLDKSMLYYLLLINSFYALLLLLAIPELLRNWRIGEDENLRLLRGTGVVPPISILVPAHDEERTIVVSVLSFLTLEYPRHEVIVVNDGSGDGTMEALRTAYELYDVPQAYPAVVEAGEVRRYYRSKVHAKLSCMDKAAGGKGDALNAALNAARYPYVLAVDADTLIEPDALLRLVRPFLLGESVAAVGGTIRVANGSVIENSRVVEARVDSRWLPGVQTVEYLRSFLFGRLGWNQLGGNLIISGAFGLFKREHMLSIGGYDTATVTEDMDLVVRLHRHLRKIGSEDKMHFVPDPVAWTEVPTTVRGLARQRDRWHRGLIATLLAHRAMLFNPRYGRVGMISFPFFVFGEMLGPLVEVIGYLGVALALVLGVVNLKFGALFLTVAVGFGLLMSLWAIVLEEVSFRRYPRRGDALRLVAFALIEGFGYRQMTVWFRLVAFWSYLRGDKRWGVMIREGSGPPASAAAQEPARAGDA